MSKNTILIADDDASIRLVLSQALAREGYQVRATSNASTLWKWVKEGEGDLVLTDVMMPDGSVFDFLPRMRMDRPSLPIIVMSAQNTVLTAIAAAEKGAYEYLPKPFDLEVMVATIRKALDGRKDYSAAAKQKKAEKDEKLPLVGRSPVMQEVYRVLSRVAGSDLTVLIQGESGVGKALVARSLHDFSRRRNEPFVRLGLAALEPSELDAALNGRRDDDAGVLKTVAGGTLLLDGLADCGMQTQARLARVLSDGASVDSIRIVATADKDLKGLVAQGLFREDLFYRINVVTIDVPPLRDRRDDIPDLARTFLSRLVSRGLPERLLDKAAAEVLSNWDWPGNVRELENLVSRLAALHPDTVIDAAAVRAELNREVLPEVSVTAPDADSSLESVTKSALRRMLSGLASNGAPLVNIYETVLEAVERPLFQLILAETKGNQIKAADILGLNRNTLRKRLQTLAIDPGNLKS